jgi:dolichol-phosphate mannosyltransferase
MTLLVRRSISPAPAAVRIAVVVPCYRVARHVEAVLAGIGPEVSRIYVVDDGCLEGTGDLVERTIADHRVEVLRNPVNQGVGGAVLLGYRRAITDGMDVVVKLDGDGQMDPRLIPNLVRPIAEGRADYVKGNRFFDLTRIRQMPTARIIGNAILSFMAKFSTGYWGIFDPTNGFTAISVPVAARLPLDKISRRFFFETDMLFHLNTLRAVVVDMPMHPVYGGESSNLKIAAVLPEFLIRHLENFGKRVFYNYFLRDMSIASLELLAGATLLLGGTLFGCYHWIRGYQTGVLTPLGTIMLAVVAILLGIQFLLAFLAYDFASVPKRPVGKDLDGMLDPADRGSHHPSPGRAAGGSEAGENFE